MSNSSAKLLYTDVENTYQPINESPNNKGASSCHVIEPQHYASTLPN